MVARVDPAEQFRCPKCNGRHAVTRRASIAKSGIADLLGIKAGGRYLLVTCGLCGFTELYDMAIIEPETSAAAGEKSSAEIAESANP